MKASQFIAELQAVVERCGDHEIVFSDEDGNRWPFGGEAFRADIEDAEGNKKNIFISIGLKWEPPK
jgi:hypothetical protein